MNAGYNYFKYTKNKIIKKQKKRQKNKEDSEFYITHSNPNLVRKYNIC